jgi:hypothetical protein
MRENIFNQVKQYVYLFIWTIHQNISFRNLGTHLKPLAI